MKESLRLCLSVCWLLFAPTALHAAGIAVISHAGIAPFKHAIEGFRTQVGLPIHVYHPGIRNEHRDYIKQAIAQQHPALIFALGKSALSIAREINNNVPTVYAFVLHPNRVYKPDTPMKHRESGIAMSITAQQQFKTLLQIAPGIHNIGVVYDPHQSAALIRQAQRAANRLGLKLIAVAVSSQKAAAQAIGDIFTHIDAMWMVPDTTVLTSTTFRQMIHLSLKHAVAMIGLAPKYVRAGSLFSLSFDSRSVGRQAGRMAGRILKGRKMPALLPPDTTNLAVNLQTASRLGLTIPARLLKQATHAYPEHNGEFH